MERKITIITILILCSLLLTNCKKEYDAIGLDLQEDLLGSLYQDTTSIIAYSIKEDSISTVGLANNVLGILHDPTFGQTEATIYTQFGVAGTSIDFGSNARCDSIVLTLHYAGYFGDTTSAISLSVFELNEALDASGKYFNYSTTDIIPQNLTYNSNFTFSPRPSTSVIIDTATYNPHLRIRLQNELGQRFIDNQASIQNNNAFLNFFKGLCIKATAATKSGCLIYTALTSSVSSISLFYHNDNNAKMKYSFICSSNSARYNHYSHDYTASTNDNFRQQVLFDNKDKGKEMLFLQPTAGVKTKVLFPYLANSFKNLNNKVVINKAELVITDVSSDADYFFQPYNLAIQRIASDGTLSYIPDDQTYTSTDYFGGIYDKTTKEYRFRVTHYVQQMILSNGADNYGLYLVVAGAGIRGNRLVFAGTNPLTDNSKRFRLEITYTTY